MTDSTFMWNPRTCEHARFEAPEVTEKLKAGWRMIVEPVEIPGSTIMYDKHGNLQYVPDQDVQGVEKVLSATDPVSQEERIRRKIAGLERIKERMTSHE